MVIREVSRFRQNITPFAIEHLECFILSLMYPLVQHCDQEIVPWTILGSLSSKSVEKHQKEKNFEKHQK